MTAKDEEFVIAQRTRRLTQQVRSLKRRRTEKISIW